MPPGYEFYEETIILVIILVLLGAEMLVSIGQILIDEVQARKTRYDEDFLKNLYQRRNDTPADSSSSTMVDSSIDPPATE
jgi:Sec-independent protein translocase protein TatA